MSSQHFGEEVAQLVNMPLTETNDQLSDGALASESGKNLPVVCVNEHVNFLPLRPKLCQFAVSVRLDVALLAVALDAHRLVVPFRVRALLRLRDDVVSVHQNEFATAVAVEQVNVHAASVVFPGQQAVGLTTTTDTLATMHRKRLEIGDAVPATIDFDCPAFADAEALLQRLLDGKMCDDLHVSKNESFFINVKPQVKLKGAAHHRPPPHFHEPNNSITKGTNRRDFRRLDCLLALLPVAFRELTLKSAILPERAVPTLIVKIPVRKGTGVLGSLRNGDDRGATTTEILRVPLPRIDRNHFLDQRTRFRLYVHLDLAHCKRFEAGGARLTGLLDDFFPLLLDHTGLFAGLLGLAGHRGSESGDNVGLAHSFVLEGLCLLANVGLDEVRLGLILRHDFHPIVGLGEGFQTTDRTLPVVILPVIRDLDAGREESLILADLHGRERGGVHV
jgi:hypothetical protein